MRGLGWTNRLLRLAAAVVMAGSTFVPAVAQDNALLEGRLLRSAASFESKGELTEAEAILLDLMRRRPTSTGGLFALERVLGSQGRSADILGTVDAFLTIDSKAAAPNILKMRVLGDADDSDGLVVAAEAWMAADPGSSDVYREIARAFVPVFGEGRAVEVLLSGRESISDPTEFAMELGDLYQALNELEKAVGEWSLAVGEEGGQVAAVVRRLQDLPGDRAKLAGPLIETLGRPGGSLARRRAGTRVALDVGLTDQALSLAKDVEGDLQGQARRGFLADLARRAEDVDSPELALWAYERLRERATRGSESRSLDQRIAESSLAVGDTARALAAQNRVASSLSSGSAERRRALAEVTRLVILQDPERGRAALDVFRREFRDAPELDPLAVTLASRFQAQGAPAEAEEILAGIDGPRSALERGYLQLGQGEVEVGLTSLREALMGLSPADATGVIALLDLMGRLEEPALTSVGKAASLGRQGRGVEGAKMLEEGVASGWAESPTILALAARFALRAGDEEMAVDLWHQLISDHPRATETPEAMLELATFTARSPEGVPEAMRMLEDLILDRPGNPLLPSARRTLDRLRREGRDQ